MKKNKLANGKFYFQLQRHHAISISCAVKNTDRFGSLMYFVEFTLSLIDFILGRRINKAWIFDIHIHSKSPLVLYHYIVKNKDHLIGKDILISFSDISAIPISKFKQIDLNLFFINRPVKIIESSYQHKSFQYNYFSFLNSTHFDINNQIPIIIEDQRLDSKVIISREYKKL